MATDTIKGVVGAGNSNPANQKVDVFETLMVLAPVNTPVMQHLFMGNYPAKEVIAPNGKFSWMEKTYLDHYTVTTQAINHSNDSITVTEQNVEDVSIFNIDDLVLADTNDTLFYVASISGTDVTLKTVDGSQAPDIPADVNLTIIASVRAEDATQRPAMAKKVVEEYNYLTIMDSTVAVTGREEAGGHYTDGMTLAERIAERQTEMKLQFERLALLSPKSGVIATSNDMIKSFGKGLLGFINTNVASGNLTESLLDNFFKEVGSKGSHERNFYMGSDLFYGVQSLIKEKIGSLPQFTTNEYGVDVATYYYGPLRINLILDPVLSENRSNWGFAVQPDKIIGRFMANDNKGSRKFRIELNTETPGADYTQARLLSDLGIQVMNESVHGLVKANV